MKYYINHSIITTITNLHSSLDYIIFIATNVYNILMFILISYTFTIISTLSYYYITVVGTSVVKVGAYNNGNLNVCGQAGVSGTTVLT